MTSLVKYSTSPRNAEHSPKVSLEQQFGKMADLVLNSSSVLRLNFFAKLNFCSSISATSPSCETLSVSVKKPTRKWHIGVLPDTQA